MWLKRHLSVQKTWSNRMVPKAARNCSLAMPRLRQAVPRKSVIVPSAAERLVKCLRWCSWRTAQHCLSHARKSSCDLIGSVHHKPILKSQKSSHGIVWFSLPIFEYIQQHRRTSQAKMGSRGRAIIHEHLQKVLSELIADDIEKRIRTRSKPGHTPTDLLIQYVSSTFILVLNWWVETRSPLSPKDVNECFCSLISPTLAAICD